MVYLFKIVIFHGYVKWLLICLLVVNFRRYQACGWDESRNAYAPDVWRRTGRGRRTW